MVYGKTALTSVLVEILVADTTSLQSRLFFSFIPSSPYLINTWVAPSISNAVYQGTGWRWGIGMWCIIFPVCALPLFFSLFSASRKAKRAGLLDGVPSPFRSMLDKSLWLDVFWQLDLPGIILIAGAFILILLPFTLYGGVSSSWASASAIAPIVVGVVIVIPLFLLWEIRFARHPAVPFRLLKDRQVLACLGVACLLNAAWYCQGDYLYYTLLVAFNQ
jgi:SIT family siderophore-iron:H+ symporter-like MFS transporter